MTVENRSFWKRRRTLLVIAIVLSPVLVIFLATRSFILSYMVSGVLQEHLGVEVEVGSAHLDWSGNIDLGDVVLKAESISGPASEVITISSLSVQYEGLLPLSNITIDSLDIGTVTIRLAENAVDSSDFNFSHLLKTVSQSTQDSVDTNETKQTVETEQPMKSLELIPVDINRLVIETGMMHGSKWSLGNRREFSVHRKSMEQGQFIFEFEDNENEFNSEVGFSTLDGGLVVEIDGVTIDQSFINLLPRTARIWCEETQLFGDVNNLIIDWSDNSNPSIQATVENISFMLPAEHGLVWAHYKNGIVEALHGNTKLDLKSGKVIYDGNAMILQDIEGNLVPPHQSHDTPVRFSANIEIYDFPNSGDLESGEWMASMLSSAPFKAVFDIEHFQPTENCEVDLPIAAAQILKIFQLKHWEIGATVTVERESTGDEVVVSGHMSVGAESGKYEGFPYPLKNLESSITFNQNDIHIVELTADGSEDAEVLIKGDVYATSEVLYVELELVAGRTPLDQHLRDALPKNIATVMDNMISHDTYEKIVGSLENSEGDTFELGGEIELLLNIKHDNRIDSGVELSGSIAFQDIGILHKEFPYPVELKNGYVELNPQGLYVPDDTFVKFESYGGGKGFLAGSILFLEEDNAAPAIFIKLEGEQVNPVLVAAVSHSAGKSNELAAWVLGGLGLSSELSAIGKVRGNDDGHIDTEFTVTIENGTAVLNEKLAKAINATGPFWPDGFEFTNVKAEILIVNDEVSMEGVTCECGDGSIKLEKMRIADSGFELKLEGTSLPISPQFVNVLPSIASEKLDTSWKLLEPGGFMNGTIEMTHKDGESSLRMGIEPTLITVSGRGDTVDLSLVRGSIVVNNTHVVFKDLEFQLQEEDELQGTLGISGEVNGDKNDFGFALDARWDNALIGSPLTRAITGMVGGQSGLEDYDSLNPTGEASATLEASTNSDGSVGYDIKIYPSSLFADLNKRKMSAFINGNDDMDKFINFTNSGIIFEELEGTLGDGKFSIDTSAESDKTINLTWEGSANDESMFAVLPSVVGDTLSAIDLQGGTSKLDNGKFTLIGERWADLDVAFTGDISLTDVSIDVGIPLKEIRGNVTVSSAYKEDQLSELSLELSVEEMSTLGRPVTDVSGKLVLKEESVLGGNGNRLEFEKMGGKSTTGGIAVDGWISVDETKDYEIEVLVSDVKIGAKESEDALASLEGDLTGWLSIAGTRGDVANRRGVGVLRVRNGKLAVDPLSITAMQLLQLALPTSRSITGADIDLYFDGDRVVLENIKLTGERSSSDLELAGEGTIDIDNFTIFARLHPRVGWPIIRDIAGAFNDKLYSIDVTGELFNPTVSIVPLPFLTPQDN